MTYKVQLNGGTKKEATEAAVRDMDAAIKRKDMTPANKEMVTKLIAALPGTHVAGVISDNNGGRVTINVTSDTLADPAIAAEAKIKKQNEVAAEKEKQAAAQGKALDKPMEGAAALGRPELAPDGGANTQPAKPLGTVGATTAPGGPVVQTPPTPAK